MEKNSVNTIKLIGITLMVIGAGLGIWGYQLSDSIGSQITEAVTGAATDRVMLHYIMGAASFVVGLYLFAKK
ncbi:DUF3185 family protein [Thiomicrospira sp. WB1]|jgi:hypothetical protein|uniref:DUF3185 family protein n=1 Tax=Thiomicrospira sp. WB1 TaxID=1685380 RepID=UPI0007475896|nr:DUF3185 family protein [Thiomicrospira sp. WB1]KUJ72506.1 hypothetical protein AVO41_01455 [Thiomicrospira sp. WB1]